MIPQEELFNYEDTKTRLVLGDKVRLEKIRDTLNQQIPDKRDLKQAMNRANMSTAIHYALNELNMNNIKRTKLFKD